LNDEKSIWCTEVPAEASGPKTRVLPCAFTAPVLSSNCQVKGARASEVTVATLLYAGK